MLRIPQGQHMHLFVEGYGFVICEAEGPSGSLGCPDLSSMWCVIIPFRGDTPRASTVNENSERQVGRYNTLKPQCESEHLQYHDFLRDPFSNRSVPHTPIKRRGCRELEPLHSQLRQRRRGLGSKMR